MPLAASDFGVSRPVPALKVNWDRVPARRLATKANWLPGWTVSPNGPLPDENVSAVSSVRSGLMASTDTLPLPRLVTRAYLPGGVQRGPGGIGPAGAHAAPGLQRPGLRVHGERQHRGPAGQRRHQHVALGVPGQRHRRVPHRLPAAVGQITQTQVQLEDLDVPAGRTHIHEGVGGGALRRGRWRCLSSRTAGQNRGQERGEPRGHDRDPQRDAHARRISEQGLRSSPQSNRPMQGWGAGSGNLATPTRALSMADAATVLIVDDDPLVRATFVRILQRGGFQLREAEDGQQGLTEFRRERPDGVLLDLRMPGIDGLDVLSTMVTEAPETPVVVASGAGTMRDAVEALRRGAWDFVTKPMYDPELLVRSLGAGDREGPPEAPERAVPAEPGAHQRRAGPGAGRAALRPAGRPAAAVPAAAPGRPAAGRPYRLPAHLPLRGAERRLRRLLPAGRSACGVLRGGRVRARRRFGVRDRHPDHPGGQVPPGPGAGWRSHRAGPGGTAGPAARRPVRVAAGKARDHVLWRAGSRMAVVCVTPTRGCFRSRS